MSLTLVLALVLGVGDRSDASQAVTAVVLGTAQDGGLPQANCRCRRCEHARRDPSRERRVASLALHDALADRTFLIDATPDLPEQLDLLRARVGLPEGRTPLDGVLLTHAHVGHYAGLIHFGREVMGSSRLPLHCTERMAGFLRANEPWSQLVDLEQVELRPFEPGERIELTPRLAVTPLAVPHRDELSDTVAFLVEGPARRLLWLPDIDGWETWERRLEDVLADVDVAFLDGTFHSADELPGRSIEDIPHPLVTATVERLGRMPDERRPETWFVHLNHSNALLGPGRGARRELERRGFGVAREGQRVPL